jgi:hypothetical protein
MPIKRYIKIKMGSAEINRLNIAYAMTKVDCYDPFTKIVAKKVINVGTSGLTNPQGIADAVVRHFRKITIQGNWSVQL